MSADGFLGRWARRKNDVLQGKPLADELPAAVAPAPAQPPEPAGANAKPPVVATANLPVDAGPAAPQSTVEIKLPTLQDVQQLSLEGDFKPFMAHGVTPEVKNAAMKKLFTDPHYNIMDGLDTYIDDYSKFEPIPQSMLRQMASAKFLQLFDEEDDKAKSAAVQTPAAASPADNPDSDPGQNVAESYENQDTAKTALSPDSACALPVAADQPNEDTHAYDPDLRLQPDHAAQSQGLGRGTQ